MTTIGGYNILDKIHEGEKSMVFRATRNSDQLPVIIKTLKEDHPTHRILTQFQQEFKISRNRSISGIIHALEMVKSDRGLALVGEDIGGQSLRRFMKRHTIGLDTFFKIALQLSRILGDIHSHQVIHKDIKPENIIVVPDTLEVKLTDFSLATQLAYHTQKIDSLENLEGTLAYMSPEQTGRVNRSIDYRSDFYSLGITFYELLAGELPFQNDDLIEIIHAHIAKPPPPIQDINPDIPKMLADLVMKLLSKNPDERYQHAYGIHADLETCFQQWQAHGTIPEFVLANHENTSKFRIIQKCFGRESEIGFLKSAFSKIALGFRDVIMVTGHSGIGKSSLVVELKDWVENEGGFFIVGKCDQMKDTIPCYPILSALKELALRLLTESSQRLEQWKKNIIKAIEPNGQLLVDVVPEVELIIGKQPPVELLPPLESKNRFNRVLQQFIEVFTKFDHPLVLFIDDLQWADSVTLEFLYQYACNDDITSFLMIGAYRNHEITTDHPLGQTLHSIEVDNFSFQRLDVPPIKEKDVIQLLAESLNQESSHMAPLGKLLFSKTGGNPFFVKTLLSSLYEDRLLWFDYNSGRWIWEHEKIEAKEVTDNVISLMVDKIQKLSPNGQFVLEVAACLGSKFHSTMLAQMSEQPLEAIQAELWAMIQEGIVVSNESQEQCDFRFSHSRIRRAAYFMMEETEKIRLHLKIGRYLLHQSTKADWEKQVFEIVNQLNIAKDVITEEQERLQLAELNLRAGKKSMLSNASEHALEYFKISTQLLPDHHWDTHYSLSFEVFFYYAECEYLNTHFDEAETLFDQLLSYAKTKQEKSQVYCTKMVLYTNWGEHEASLAAGLEALRLFDVGIDLAVGEDETNRRFLELHKILETKEIEQLRNLPVMTDPDQLALCQIFMNLGPSAYALGKALSEITFQVIRLMLKYGNSPDGIYAYNGFGIQLALRFNDYNAGYKYSKLTLDLSEDIGNTFTKCRAYHTVGLISAWKFHMRQCVKYVNQAFKFGLECGDLVYASYAISTVPTFILFSDSRLEEVQRVNQRALDFLKRSKDRDTTDFLIVIQQNILHAQGLTDSDTSYDDDSIEESELFEHIHSGSNVSNLIWYYIIKFRSMYLVGAYDVCWDLIGQLKENVKSSLFIGVHLPEFWFLYGLVIADTFETLSEIEQQQEWESLKESQQRLEHWSRSCPENYEHKYLLITAEIHRLENSPYEAMEYYDLAVKSAKQYDFLRSTAIAHEQAAKFHLARGFEQYAKHHWVEAHYFYQQWGSTRKVEALEKKFPLYFDTALTKGTKAHLTTVIGSSTGEGVSELDFGTLMKTTQTISQEIVLQQLLKKLLSVLMENAGAEKGALILERSGKYYIEAEGHISQPEIRVFDPIPLEHPEVSGYVPSFPIKLIQYSALTKEPVILNDAAKEGLFTKIPYVVKHHPKSILCSPILLKSQIVGLIYLENNLTVGAFTPARLEVLNLLSAQAAISIENARLYEAYGRFVPHTFLNLLNKKNIIDVQLGDQIRQAMTILFADLRDFTKLSENMTPEENFRFLNSYLQTMGPIIRENGGFIDKYIGDAIMALFDKSEDDAVRASIAMLQELKIYNQHRTKQGYTPIRIGLGINTGTLMLGTIGEAHRMEGTVISDAVNLASRIEGLTKVYGTPLLISENTLAKLQNPQQYHIRFLDRVMVKGKSRAVTVYEIFDADPPEWQQLKTQTFPQFEQAWEHYKNKQFPEAQKLFKECLARNPQDKAPQVYLDRIDHFLKYGIDSDWDGITRLENK